MIDQPLSITPITDMFMDRMDEQYVRRVLHYLRNILGCRVEPLEDKPGYYIHFPIGTVEEVYPGQSTQWNYKTIIRLPSGVTLTKTISTNIRDQRISTTMLAFPNVILDGPEPPEV